MDNLKEIYYNAKHPSGFASAKSLVSGAGATKKQVAKWLRAQPAYTLHKFVRKQGFPTRAYKTSGLDELWQADVMEMIPYAKINNGYKYILTVIDVFSRYAWARPLKTKSAQDVADAFTNIFKTLFGRHTPPRYIQTDQGKEFYNTKVKSVFTKHGVKQHYSVYSQYKAAIVERFNRTLRTRLSRYFTYTNKKMWHNVLPDLLQSYNNNKHRGIFGYRPVDITKETAMILWQLKNKKNTTSKSSPKLKLLDYCRISRIKGPFIKNFDQNWSEEVFRVNGIHKTPPPIRYTLEDWNGNVIAGKFYEPELQKVAKPEIFRIERVIRTKGTGKHKQYYVKWHGYPAQYNSWIRAQDVI